MKMKKLVDVTLVCAETSVRAHKVVLSACSPFFQRIFSENPCNPVIVLKNFHGWEVQAIVDFMYNGEISVGQEQLQTLIKAADSLQVCAFAHQDQLGIDEGNEFIDDMASEGVITIDSDSDDELEKMESNDTDDTVNTVNTVNTVDEQELMSEFATLKRRRKKSYASE